MGSLRWVVAVFCTLLCVLLPAGGVGGRVWTSRNGRFTVEADLVDFQDGQVTAEIPVRPSYDKGRTVSPGGTYFAVFTTSGYRIRIFDTRNGVDMVTFLRLQQWAEADRWLRTIEIPLPIFDPQVNRGLGESILSPNGARTVREPEPALESRPRGARA